jgi:hypothetical protein
MIREFVSMPEIIGAQPGARGLSWRKRAPIGVRQRSQLRRRGLAGPPRSTEVGYLPFAQDAAARVPQAFPLRRTRALVRTLSMITGGAPRAPGVRPHRGCKVQRRTSYLDTSRSSPTSAASAVHRRCRMLYRRATRIALLRDVAAPRLDGGLRVLRRGSPD